MKEKILLNLLFRLERKEKKKGRKSGHCFSVISLKISVNTRNIRPSVE
jgi:hypothetical protein